MRLWAEEHKSGSIELLMTLPISLAEAVLGKFLAAWCFTAVALVGTFPIWLTVSYLGDPDHGIIIAGYLGSLLMAGAYLAIVSGFPIVLDFFSGWAPAFVVNAIASLSFLTHFDAIIQGVIDLKDIVYFASLIGFWLFANAVLVEIKKS